MLLINMLQKILKKKLHKIVVFVSEWEVQNRLIAKRVSDVRGKRGNCA